MVAKFPPKRHLSALTMTRILEHSLAQLNGTTEEWLKIKAIEELRNGGSLKSSLQTSRK